MNEVTIRTDNSAKGIEKINRLWQDMMNGNTALVINQDTMLISRYSHYASDETGPYDLSILAVDKEFLHQLDEKSAHGKYKKYDLCADNNDVPPNVQKAWQQVWMDQKIGKIKRCYTEDYECIIQPNRSPDHKLHCLLYIAIEKTSSFEPANFRQK